MESDERSALLVCGMVCLDQVTVIREYPKQDTDQRSLDQYKTRGGNASNTATVLAQLGYKPIFLGTLVGNSVETNFLLEDFSKAGVSVSPRCPEYPGYLVPNTVCLLTRGTGHRTLIHTNINLPELTLGDLQQIQLAQYSWVHLEGRPGNHGNLLKMLRYLAGQPVPVSVEVELAGTGSEEFIPLADVVFISKDIGKAHGCTTMEETVRMFLPRLKPGGKLIVPWGEEGAAGGQTTGLESLDSNGERTGAGKLDIFSCPAYHPESGVVDTIGAGDTFVAAVIGKLSDGESLRTSIQFGCQVAGTKVGMPGFMGIGDRLRNIIN